MFVRQPNEEGTDGAKAMLADGLFTRFPKPDFALDTPDVSQLPRWHDVSTALIQPWRRKIAHSTLRPVEPKDFGQEASERLMR